MEAKLTAGEREEKKHVESRHRCALVIPLLKNRYRLEAGTVLDTLGTVPSLPPLVCLLLLEQARERERERGVFESDEDRKKPYYQPRNTSVLESE